MAEAATPLVTVSVVSHGHKLLVDMLLRDLAPLKTVQRVVLTENIADAPIEIPPELEGRITFVRNAEPRGFGANHNAAFKHCETPFYCVLNPDIRLTEDPFPTLISLLNPDDALAAPTVRNRQNGVEDSARRFPTPFSLLLRLLKIDDDSDRPSDAESAFHPDWVAGMFMLMARETYAELGGFDESYFLYCEDIDLCARLRRHGYRIVVSRNLSVIHDARRSSHRSLRYAAWHIGGLLRFFASHPLIRYRSTARFRQKRPFPHAGLNIESKQ